MQTYVESSTPPEKICHWLRNELPQIVLMLVLLATAREASRCHTGLTAATTELERAVNWVWCK